MFYLTLKINDAVFHSRPKHSIQQQTSTKIVNHCQNIGWLHFSFLEHYQLLDVNKIFLIKSSKQKPRYTYFVVH